jgi:hypothetical protein
MAQNLVKNAFWESLFRTVLDFEISKFSLRKSCIFLRLGTSYKIETLHAHALLG